MENAQVIINEILKGQENRGANFMGIENYTSKSTGELANFVVNFGINYGNAKEKSIEILNSLTENDFSAMAEMFGVVNHAGEKYATNKGAEKFLTEGKLPKEGTKARIKVLNGVKETKTLKTIRDEMVQSMLDNENEDTRSNQSKAQDDTYENIGRGIRMHRETKEYHFYAALASKDILEYGEYKKSTPKPETLQKNAIKRYCKEVLNKELPIAKFRDFVVTGEQMRKVNVTGDTFTFVD
jgi:uncharacterized protein YaaR (DUF327 family)